MEDTLRHDRLGVLDGLRGLAILLVVWYHLTLVSGFSPTTIPLLSIFSTNGFLGVDLFFFVSGFCICYPYARARRDGRERPDIRGFIRRRAAKIAPSYLLALSLFALVYHARFSGFGDELGEYVAHLTFLHVFSSVTFGSFSGPLWTLGVEVQFYALFALLAPYFERRPLVVYGAFFATSLAYRGVLAHVGLDADFTWINQLPAVLDVFGAGMLAALAVVALRDYVPTRPQIALATACAALAAVAAIVGLIDLTAVTRIHGVDGAHRWLNAWRFAFGPLLVVAMLGLAFGARRIRATIGSPALTWLSVVSYNAYLWNLEIAVALHNAGLPAWAVFWLGATATLVVSSAITYAFERPLQGYVLKVSVAPLRRALAAVPPAARRMLAVD